MTQFLGDIAGILEIFAIAAGLVLLHAASKEPAAKFMKAAGLVLVVGGIGVGLCTTWYWFKYHAAGDFDRAVPHHMQMSPGAMAGAHMMPAMHVNPQASCAP